MKRRTKHPILDLLVVNHDARLRKKCHEAIFDTKFNRSGAAIVRTARAPQIQRGTIGFELSHMFDDARDRNPSPASGSYQRVIDVDVNDHRLDLSGQPLGQALEGRRPIRRIQPRLDETKAFGVLLRCD